MAGISTAALFLVLLCVTQTTSTLAKVVKYHLEIEYGFASPDCVERQIVTINGQYPPPTLYATEGDTLKVWVTNKLPTGEGVTIHWHGFTQIGSPWMDGVGYVSQCPIETEETFLYEFLADKAGTFVYHGHYGLHITEGLAGELIIYDKKRFRKPYKYDDELSLLLTDWWHRPTKEIALGLLSPAPKWRFPGEPQALLIDGKGKYNCSLIPTGGVPGSADVLTCNASSPDCSRSVYTVEQGKTYRLRVSNAGTLSHLNMIIEGHNMAIIEADAYYTKPVKVDSLDVYNGQGYSVIFTANQPPGNYWIGISVRSRRPRTPTGLAILNYKGVPVADPLTPTPVSPLWDDTDYSIAQFKSIKSLGVDTKPVPKKSDYQLVMLNEQTRWNGVIKWSINNVSWTEPHTPFILSSYFGLKPPAPPPIDPPVYDYTQPPPNANTTIGASYYTLPFGKVIDVTLQNANLLNPNQSDVHPWHIHGHHFWVVGSGPGKFNPATDPAKYNTVDPARRYTATVFPYGWLTVRFVADNPGFWAFHCHIIFHQLMGMGFAIAEGVDMIPPPPKDLQLCGEIDYGFLLKHAKKN